MDEAMSGLTDILSWSTELNSTSFETASSLAAAILSVAFIFVCWSVATKKENARLYVITWFILVVFTIIFIVK